MRPLCEVSKRPLKLYGDSLYFFDICAIGRIPMLFLTRLLAECGTLPFSRTPGTAEYAMSYSLSQAGAEAFISAGMKEALHYAQLMKIEDIHTVIDLVVMKLMVDITNIRIMELNVKSVHASMLDGATSIPAGIYDVDVEMAMEWHLMDTISASESSGTGKFRIQGVNMTVQIVTGLDEECPGHFTISSDYTLLVFKKLSIELKGEFPPILQVFLDLLLEGLQDYITKIISGILYSAIEGILAKMLPENGYYLQHYYNEDVIKDMRFVDKILVMNRMAVFVFSGYTYYGPDLDDEYMSAELLNPFLFNRHNRQAVFAIHEEGFNNNFYVFHKYFNSFSNEQCEARAPPRVIFENVAARIVAELRCGGVGYTVQLRGSAVVQMVENKNFDDTEINTTLISFKTACASAVSEEGDAHLADALEVCEQYAAWFSQENERFSYQINNTPFMDVDKFDVVYDSREHVIRLLGDVKL